MTFQEIKRRPNLFNVSGDLLGWTGLSLKELKFRLERRQIHSIDAEHDYWNPRSVTEQRWAYAHSVNYLWGNAPHPALGPSFLDRLGDDPAATQPIIEFAGGVGNNNLYLASRGIPSAYTGVGIMEKEFFRYRLARHGLSSLVEIVEPHDPLTFEMDPLAAFRPPRKYGTIFAFDVLEHIPHYEEVVRTMVNSDSWIEPQLLTRL